MKKLLALAVFLGALLYPVLAKSATCASGSTCVPKADMATFLTLLKDQKCRSGTAPQITLDSIQVIVDKQERVYYSGNAPRPYKVNINWCNYTIEATATVRLQVAQLVAPVWGWSFRPKLAATYLFIDAFNRPAFTDAIDVGVLLEFFHWKYLNANGDVGFRSAGLGLGVDILKNVSVYAGYAFSFQSLHATPVVGVALALW